MAAVNPPLPAPPDQPKKPIDWTAILIPIAFVVIAVVVVVFIIVAISGSKGVLTSLADDKIARGLITFLITLATVAIAIILALSAVISDPAAVKDRFALGKEVLSILIGVLGTIVGFYFGSAVTGQSSPLRVASVFLTNEQPKKGDTTTLLGLVSGGKPPYSYTITFTPTDIPGAKDLPATDGIIKYDVKIPADIKTDTPETFVIDVKDSDGKAASYNKDGAKKIAIKAD